MNVGLKSSHILDPDVFAQLHERCREHPRPLLFATLSGAHLYGFPSDDSDYDLRGCHLLPIEAVVGLDPPRETIEWMGAEGGIDWDIVTHEARKFFTLLLKKNGYVLEQVYSPIVLYDAGVLDELRAICRGLITRHHWLHYRGFAANEWKLFLKQPERRVKRLLYVFRVLLVGIHMMRTGEVEPHLPTLLCSYPLPYVDALIERKVAGYEAVSMPDSEAEFYAAEYERLLAVLREAGERSALPDEPTAKPALNDLLLRLRLGGLPAAS